MSKWAHIPAVSGVYKGFVGSECVYVGSCLNLRTRLANHKLRFVCESWEWITVPPERLIAEEQALLDRYSPRLNKTKKAWRNSMTPSRAKSIRFDQRIITAFERFCAENAKDERAVLSDLIVEYLKKQHAWPPKEGK